MANAIPEGAGRASSGSLPLVSPVATATGTFSHSGGHDPHDDNHHHHHHGPLDREKALRFGSLGFEPVFNTRYNKERVVSPGVGFHALQAVLPLLIGIVTALAATLVGLVAEFIGEGRCNLVQHLIRGSNWPAAWCASTGIMLACALAGSLPVALHAKTAGASGIPQLIGLLNGCDVRADFTWRQLAARAFGVALAVASGLAVGPEGPMIFVGASVGFLFSHLPQEPWVWRVLGRPPVTAGDDVYLRDYTSIGAACGIAAAFRAPIAGTLFIVEEAASHFKREDISKIFFGGLASLETVMLFNSAGSVLEYGVTTGAMCDKNPSYAFVIYILIGVACGLFGALFNWINVKCATFRALHANAAMPLRRLGDIVVLCLISSSLWLAAAAVFPEEPSTATHLFQSSDGCIKTDWRNQVISGGVIEIVSGDAGNAHQEKYLPRPCLYGVQYDAFLCPQAFDLAASSATGSGYAKACTTNLLATWPTIAGRADSTSYCCGFEAAQGVDKLANLREGRFYLPSNASCTLDLGDSMPSLTGDGGKFNPMAGLSLVPFKTSCQNLFARGSPGSLGLGALGLFFVFFFLMVAVTSGSAIPSGMLMPHMVIGALIGRMLMVVAIEIQSSLGLISKLGEANTMWSSGYAPFFAAGGPLSSINTLLLNSIPDPGMGAVVGAAAFIGGSGRIALFTTVMIVEVTGDPLTIFPVGFATIIAVIVGDYFNHGLYHALMDVQSLPYLPDRWQGKELPPGLCVSDMMPRNPVACISLSGGRAAVEAALAGNNFQGFPVIDEEGAVVGLAARRCLEAILEEEEVEIGSVTDFHPLTVRPGYPLQMAYQLFKQMEMKSLIVVNSKHEPQAVMTRFAFLSWRVAERLGEARLQELQRQEEEHERARELALQTGGTLRPGRRSIAIPP